jgi:hypothetical protein
VGLLGDETQAADLVKQLSATQAAGDRADIEKALLAITGRRGAQCLPSLLPLAKNPDAGLRKIALHTLSSVGGAPALDAVKATLADADETVQDEAVRTLSTWPNSWPDDTAVAGPLLQLARTGKKTSHQVLGVRGYLQCVQGDKKLSDDQKLAKLDDLLPLIKRPEEKRQVIAALGTLPVVAALDKLTGFVAEEAVSEDACSALVTLAARNDIKGATADQRRKALQTVVDKSTSDATKKKAQKALNGVK